MFIMPVALSLVQIEDERKKVKVALLAAGVPSRTVGAIETRVLGCRLKMFFDQSAHAFLLV
jgi:hypothetical protein